MTEMEKVISDVISAFDEWENNMCFPGEDWSDVHQSRDMVIALLKAQDKDAEIIRKCRDGKVLKHVGAGVVVLNYEWWRKMVEKCDHIKIVPSVEDLLKAQEPRVVRISELTSGEPMLVWLEDIDKTETVAGMIFDYVPGRLGFKLTDIGSMDRIYPRIEDYLTRWRCWNSRPTDAQREKVKWDG